MENRIFRAALKQLHDRAGRRLSRADRTRLLDVVNDETMCDLVYLHFQSQLSDAEANDTPTPDVDPTPSPAPSPRPTPILDKFGAMFKWVIEHQEEVIAFVTAMGKAVAAIVLMFL